MNEKNLTPTMRLRWARFYRHDRDETPAGTAPGWGNDQQYRLQQFWEAGGQTDEDGQPVGEWRDIEVHTAFVEVKY